VYFTREADGPRQAYWGRVCMDRSKLTLTAGFKHLDALFVITLAAIALMWIGIYFTTRIVTKPIVRLSEMVGEFRSTGRMGATTAPRGHVYYIACHRIASTAWSHNHIVRPRELLMRETQACAVTTPMKERADVDTEPASRRPRVGQSSHEIVGSGPRSPLQVRPTSRQSSRYRREVLMFMANRHGASSSPSKPVHDHSAHRIAASRSSPSNAADLC
jgi:hypothetical protein